MKLAALFRHLLLALSILGIGVLILGNSGDRVFATQVVLISFATWYLSGAKEDRRRIESRSVLNHRALVSAQSACLALATLSLLFVSNSQIPIVFFLLILIYYSLMFFDIQSGSPHSLLSFGLRLIIGQFVLLESLAFLYPGFVSSADTYRDFSIARSILVSSGGLPRDFGAITWYNFSPMTSLLYSAGVILSGLPLRITELVLGFVFSALPVLMVGSVVRKLMDDAFLVKGSMIIMSLLPAYWQYATQPIPEVLALVFLMECILLCLLRNKASAYLCIGIMTVATVFTHGGIALILVAIAGLLYVGTRLRQFLYTTVIGAFVFLAYCIYASVQGGPSGLTTVVSSLQAILTPSGQL